MLPQVNVWWLCCHHARQHRVDIYHSSNGNASVSHGLLGACSEQGEASWQHQPSHHLKAKMSKPKGVGCVSELVNQSRWSLKRSFARRPIIGSKKPRRRIIHIETLRILRVQCDLSFLRREGFTRHASFLFAAAAVAAARGGPYLNQVSAGYFRADPFAHCERPALQQGW